MKRFISRSALAALIIFASWFVAFLLLRQVWLVRGGIGWRPSDVEVHERFIHPGADATGLAVAAVAVLLRAAVRKRRFAVWPEVLGTAGAIVAAVGLFWFSAESIPRIPTPGRGAGFFLENAFAYALVVEAMFAILTVLGRRTEE